MKATKTYNGKWRCLAYKNGKRKSFTANTKKEAEALAYEWKLTKKQIETKKITLSQAIDLYIEKKSNVLSPRTIQSYNSLKRIYFTNLQQLSVNEITQEMLQKEVNALAKRTAAKTTINAYHFIKTILEDYTDNHFSCSLPQKQKKEYNVPTADEVKLLLSNSVGDLHTAILLSAFGGLRRGEICALTKKDLNKEGIRVNKDVVIDSDKKWIVKEPKTYTSNRFVMLPDFVINQIKLPIKLSPNNITGRFCVLRDSLGLSCRFHDLRHFYASILHAKGIPDAYIMKMCGWSTDAVLKSVYRNSLDDELSKFKKQTNAYFEETFCKKDKIIYLKKA